MYRYVLEKERVAFLTIDGTTQEFGPVFLVRRNSNYINLRQNARHGELAEIEYRITSGHVWSLEYLFMP